MTTSDTRSGGIAGFFEAAANLVEAVNVPLLLVCRWATIGLLTAIVAVVGSGVWWRYVLNDSLFWTEEIAKYLMVWMAFAGAPVAHNVGGHVGIELFPENLPARLRQLVYAIIHLLTIAVMVALAYYGWKLAANAWRQSAATIDLRLFWIYVSLPIGAVLLGLISLQFYFSAMAGALGSRQGYRPVDPPPGQVEYE